MELAADLVVSTLVDESDGNFGIGDFSLRKLLLFATTRVTDDVIYFDAGLFSSGPATIVLSYDGSDAGAVADQLTIDSNVTIEGPGAEPVVREREQRDPGISR